MLATITTTPLDNTSGIGAFCHNFNKCGKTATQCEESEGRQIPHCGGFHCKALACAKLTTAPPVPKPQKAKIDDFWGEDTTPLNYGGRAGNPLALAEGGG